MAHEYFLKASFTSADKKALEALFHSTIHLQAKTKKGNTLWELRGSSAHTEMPIVSVAFHEGGIAITQYLYPDPWYGLSASLDYLRSADISYSIEEL